MVFKVFNPKTFCDQLEHQAILYNLKISIFSCKTLYFYFVFQQLLGDTLPCFTYQSCK